MIRITTDANAREKLLAALATVTAESSDELAAELSFMRQAFDREWRAARPAVPASIYVLIGAPLGETFDLGSLATGGRDLIGTAGFEPLTSEDGPSSP